ncbi:monocarboxylate transporter [Pseudozyma hubeiensis SY62]|uniref:Monocarboxylate transporter n=1 Tax=Pseudozyma hubeiensis (strain SY62) TaxID=1305764 RepID=R9PAF5_PSEHS|nr:monocarboxylate transporter [Pseudozyma hubeiensis SY62]GAC95085.1 monocarboxylate transporter [Pseudozyma hubeiensis SY62]
MREKEFWSLNFRSTFFFPASNTLSSATPPAQIVVIIRTGPVCVALVSARLSKCGELCQGLFSCLGKLLRCEQCSLLRLEDHHRGSQTASIKADDSVARNRRFRSQAAGVFGNRLRNHRRFRPYAASARSSADDRVIDDPDSTLFFAVTNDGLSALRQSSC